MVRMGNISNSQIDAAKTASEQVGAWLAASEHYRNLTAQILREHRVAGRKLAATAINLPHSQPRWTILPLPATAGTMLAARARYARTSCLHNEFEAFLKLLNEGGARAYRDFIAFHAPQFARNPRAQKQAAVAGNFLCKLAQEGARIGFDPEAINLEDLQRPEPVPSLSDALAARFNLSALLSLVDYGEHEQENHANDFAQQTAQQHRELPEQSHNLQYAGKFDAINLDSAQLNDLPQLIEQLDALASELAEYRNRCITLATKLREAVTWEHLSKADLDQLVALSWQPLKLNVLKNAGITNVAQLLDGSCRISTISGIGEKTSQAIMSAAHTLQREIFAETPARINPKSPSAEAAALIQALLEWEQVQNWLGQDNRSVLAFAAAIKPRVHQLAIGANRVIVVGRGRPAKDFLIYLRQVRQLAQQYQNLQSPIREKLKIDHVDVWQEFNSKAASFYAQMAEMGIPTSDTKRITGELPTQVVERVQSTALNTNLLTVPLRGYQNFGARFILAQEKVILGDEMGLGKTLEALAVAAHLSENSAAQTVVVCPAAVVTNWIREIDSKTRVGAYRLHGNARENAAKEWLDAGGIAVTTYESLGWFLHWLTNHAPADFELSYVISDEAHYVKNEDAKRSKRTSYLLNRARFAALLTGTPMENNPEEFRTLIRHIQPHIANMQALRPVQFRKRVAPIYLRRTQEDVLDELPDLIETTAWIDFSAEDEEIYTGAVRDGNFMAMRQAAMICPQSAKIARLQEILGEAKSNGWKTIVYSYFLRPLEVLRDCLMYSSNLPGQEACDNESLSANPNLHVIGPLTGAVAPDRRQQMVDELSAAAPGAVLLAQINAGGIGLNIQAANVVIICEPQLKPTIEWQAIARSHRMGQTSAVRVYRLLSAHGVDAELNRRLAYKKQLFDEYADISETANAEASAASISAISASQSQSTQNSKQLTSPIAAPQNKASASIQSPDQTQDAPLMAQETIRDIIAAEKIRLGLADESPCEK